MTIVQCASCEGYGWQDDDDGSAAYCDWCGGVGYVYRDASGVDRKIPPSDFETVTEELERLEAERLRAMGYTGGAKRPWEQEIRRKRMPPENQ